MSTPLPPFIKVYIHHSLGNWDKTEYNGLHFKKKKKDSNHRASVNCQYVELNLHMKSIVL